MILEMVRNCNIIEGCVGAVLEHVVMFVIEFGACSSMITYELTNAIRWFSPYLALL